MKGNGRDAQLIQQSVYNGGQAVGDSGEGGGILRDGGHQGKMTLAVLLVVVSDTGLLCQSSCRGHFHHFQSKAVCTIPAAVPIRCTRRTRVAIEPDTGHMPCIPIEIITGQVFVNNVLFHSHEDGIRNISLTAAKAKAPVQLLKCDADGVAGNGRVLTRSERFPIGRDDRGKRRRRCR